MAKIAHYRFENKNLIVQFDAICEYLGSTRHEVIEDIIERLVDKLADKLTELDYHP